MGKKKLQIKTSNLQVYSLEIIIIIKFIFLGGLQGLNRQETLPQLEKKIEITKERSFKFKNSMKSQNNKKNHKN
jgi:hypothetical protein